MSMNIKTIRKLKSNYFMNSDKVELDLVFEKVLSIDIEEESVIENLDNVIQEVKTILTSGPCWEFNPTCSLIYKKTFEIDDNKLKQFIKDNCFIEIEDLDVNNNFVRITIPVKILMGNVKTIPDDLLLKSDEFLITTIFGEITL